MALSFSSRDGLFASVDCRSWDDFRLTAPTVLREITGNNEIADRFIFRGQSCADWKLESSFDRQTGNLSRARRDKKYKEYMRSFRENYSVYGGIGDSQFSDKFSEFDKLSEVEVEAVAQHFGLGTRLLDWSMSMYVSVFFAVSRIDQCISGKVSVWALDINILNEFSENDIVLLKDFYRGNIRNLWQMGIFLRNLSQHDDLKILFMKNGNSYDIKLNSGPPALIRFDFPSDDHDKVVDDLQMMRINSMTIFPGIEGVIGWIKRKNGM